MKKTRSTLLLLLVFSCSNKEKTAPVYKSWDVMLQDSSTHVFLALSPSYDTLLRWTHYQCGMPYYKIRIQSSAYPIHKENGFFDLEIPNRRYQITFEQQLFRFARPLARKKDIIERHNAQVGYSIEDPQTVTTQYDTLLLLPENTYSIFANYRRDNEKKGYIQTVTTYAQTPYSFITITFEKSSEEHPLNRSVFINECIGVIKAMEFRKHKT